MSSQFNFFQLAPGDQSVQYLAYLFGSVNGVLNVNDINPKSITILGTLFNVFNTTIATIAALMIVYVTVVGVIGSAAEGEMMGRKWKSVWIPIRAVLGIALMVPAGSGYSGIQVAMMWVVVQGVGAADVVWNTALNYVKLTGSIYKQSSLPSEDATPNKQALQALFQGIVCDISERNTRPAPLAYDTSKYYCNVNGATDAKFCSSPLPNIDPNILAAPTINFGTRTSGLKCGMLEYCSQKVLCNADQGGSEDSLACITCKAQRAALSGIIATFTNIAQAMTNADYAYRCFMDDSDTGSCKIDQQWIQQYCTANKISDCTAKTGPFPRDSLNKPNASETAVKNIYWPFWQQLEPSLDKKDVLKTVSDNYTYALEQATQEYIARYGGSGQEFDKLLDQALIEAAANGWIVAGAFYNSLARASTNSAASLVAGRNPTLKFTTDTPDVNTNPEYRVNYTAAAALLTASEVANGVNKDKEPPSPKPTDSMTDAISKAQGSFQAMLTGDAAANPLLALQLTGAYFLWLAQGMFLLMFLGAPALAALASLGSVQIAGFGFAEGAPGAALRTSLGYFVVPLLYLVLAFLFTTGALLGVYVPLIPAIVFTFGAIAWLISVIEMMVAGPIVALGIMSPSGQHEILSKAEHGFMNLVGIFLRPSLMIFGLIASLLLAVVVVRMVNFMFWTIMGNTLILGSVWGVGFVIAVLIYMYIIVAALNKCFSLINTVPVQVMRWIGGQMEGGEAPQEIGQKAEQATGALGGGARSQAAGTVKQAGSLKKLEPKDLKISDKDDGTT